MKYESKVNTEGGVSLTADQEGVIEFKDVSFTYPSKPTVEVLKKVSFTVDNLKNRVVALVGTSGCGKSSIISMMERFYDPNSGQVMFNGTDIRELEPRWYHS
jgi:ATP-binding cassette, subfamily B (MDR/TAP), member 1